MNFKFASFHKGWYFHKPHLVGLDGMNDVNNFVIYKDGIEKVRGWKLLNLNPTDSNINAFTGNVIDDFTQIINTFS